ncbi:hypothetical protein OHA37_39510 [Streptomyces sp. NBC_00335]|uniref:hypothetical protein n=1 Tax=unclassified Streptomyces TaxID=2593676 RepID=UPI0022597A44|nr:MULTISPECIES: hypothetical protein [unclassified Streptomyces]MCX5409915.1 hypothetical protein [Streptomyces sp. NBC_00086]
MAQLLVGCGELWENATVGLDAELCRVEEVLEALEVFPQGWYSGGDSLLRGVDLPRDATALAGLLPMKLSVEEPVDSDLLERAAGVLRKASWGQIDWMALSWPAVPELDLGPEHARTGVQACFNSDADGNPATNHTVYVHVRPFTEERAQHLAKQIGHEIVGPSEQGW